MKSNVIFFHLGLKIETFNNALKQVFLLLILILINFFVESGISLNKIILSSILFPNSSF